MLSVENRTFNHQNLFISFENIACYKYSLSISFSTFTLYSIWALISKKDNKEISDNISSFFIVFI